MKSFFLYSFILTLFSITNIKHQGSNYKKNLIFSDKQMRLVVFVDRNTKEHLAYKIWEGTKNDWSSFGRKMMKKEAEKRYNNALLKDFLPDNECMLVYSLIESGKKRYKRASGSKSYLQKRKKELSKFEKTFNFHETKCL